MNASACIVLLIPSWVSCDAAAIAYTFELRVFVRLCMRPILHELFSLSLSLSISVRWPHPLSIRRMYPVAPPGCNYPLPNSDRRSICLSALLQIPCRIARDTLTVGVRFHQGLDVRFEGGFSIGKCAIAHVGLALITAAASGRD